MDQFGIPTFIRAVILSLPGILREAVLHWKAVSGKMAARSFTALAPSFGTTPVGGWPNSPTTKKVQSMRFCPQKLPAELHPTNQKTERDEPRSNHENSHFLTARNTSSCGNFLGASSVEASGHAQSGDVS